MPEVTIRPTTETDLTLLLAWRQNPVVMHYYNDWGETWEEHRAWWEGKPISYIIEMEGRPVGELHATVNERLVEVGISIGDFTSWGRGVGPEAMSMFLQKLLEMVPGAVIVATVHPDNLRSQRLFAKVGFRKSMILENGFTLMKRGRPV